MSQSQGIEVRRPSRRTIATGAAWAVPVIAVGAAAPLASASPTCVPEFEVVPEESFKCCNTAIKNMKPSQLQRRETRIRVTVLAPTDRVVFYLREVVSEAGNFKASESDVAALIRNAAQRLPVP